MFLKKLSKFSSEMDGKNGRKKVMHNLSTNYGGVSHKVFVENHSQKNNKTKPPEAYPHFPQALRLLLLPIYVSLYLSICPAKRESERNNERA